MYKVLAACGAGMGSSQIIKMKIQKVYDKLGLKVEITHASVGQCKTEVNRYDVVYTMTALVSQFKNVGENTKIIGLVNVMSEAEIEAKTREALGL